MNPYRARRGLAALAALTVLALPLAVFVRWAGPLEYYGGGEFPRGQAAYLMMRPAGHLAFGLLFLQVLLGTQHERLGRWLGVRTLLPWHRALGVMAIGFALLHPLLFAWARSLRSGRLELFATLLPNPAENYWERMLFVGALALYALLLGALAAACGPRVAPRGWLWVHRINYAAFGLAFWHGISVGAETRLPQLLVFYWALFALGLAALMEKTLRTWRRAGGKPALRPESLSPL